MEERGHALARGATILGEVVGYGATCDAHHPTAPHPEGAGAKEAIRIALAQAEVGPSAVGYINAHGTSTPYNDKIETMAVRATLGGGIPMSSTKSMTGHLIGAAGAFEAWVCLQVLQTGWLPPTINYVHPDPECDLDYVPNVARSVVGGVDVALTNSFGFGGHNVTLALRSAR